MKLATAGAIGGVAILIGIVLLGPVPPHDYFRSVRGHIKWERAHYFKGTDPATGTPQYIRSQLCEFVGLTKKEIDVAMAGEGLSYSAQVAAGMNAPIYIYSNRKPDYHVEAEFGAVYSAVTEDLTPREVLWVRMTHLGHDPFKVK